MKELNVDLKEKLIISRKAHLILPTHRLIDQASELSKGKKKIGSTLKGIGPTYMDKTRRNGLRVGDLETNATEMRMINNNTIRIVVEEINTLSVSLEEESSSTLPE